MEELDNNTSEKQDLTPIRNEKGQIVSGTANPNGRPKGAKNFTTKVKEALDKLSEDGLMTNEEALVKKILTKAIKQGDNKMIELIWNYYDGKPNQRVENNLSGDITFKWGDEEDKE